MTRGPLPNPSSRRGKMRRDGAVASGYVRLHADPDRKVPALPNRKGGWLKETRVWWTEMWTSPMGQEFLTVDAYPLARLAMLREQYEAGDERGSLLTAISALEASFGLTPHSRARLRWTVVGEPNEGPGSIDLTLANRRAERRRVATDRRPK